MPDLQTGPDRRAQAAIAALQGRIEAEATRLCRIMGLEGPEWVAKVARYIRCNGIRELRIAVEEYQVTLKGLAKAHRPTTIDHPWAYVKRITNQRWARSRHLYLLLGLYEHSLRARIELLLRQYLDDPRWWETPERFMPEEEAQHMLRANPQIRSRAPANPTEIPPMARFSKAETFLEMTTLPELQSIVWHLWEPLFKHVLRRKGRPIKKSWIQAAFEDATQIRNDVMHSRAVKQKAFPGRRATLVALLHILEWNVEGALSSIEASSLLT